MPHFATFRFSGPSEITAIVAPAIAREHVDDVYCRTVLPFSLQVFGLEVLHASGVVTGRGIVAFCASSETGKSTVAYGLHRRGYGLWADDTVAFQASAEGVQVFQLPFRIRLRPPSQSYFAQPGEFREPEIRERDLSPRPRPLAAVFVLQRVPDTDAALVEVKRLPAPDALPAVLAHAQSFSEDDPSRKRRLVDQYLALVANVPVFTLRFPVGLERLGELLDAIERSIA